MPTISRRGLIAAGSASGLAGAALIGTSSPASASSTGATELITPFRLQDSRTMEPDKYSTAAQDSLAVDGLLGKCGVILNVTVTQTEGFGFFRIGDGFETAPTTSNINWYEDGQTLANMAMVAVEPTSGGIDIQGGGDGRAHLIIDVLGFIA
ncbi:MAG: hypothetical protein AAF945_19295 [Actinomycetota bacterium]